MAHSTCFLLPFDWKPAEKQKFLGYTFYMETRNYLTFGIGIWIRQAFLAMKKKWTTHKKKNQLQIHGS